MVVVDRKQVPQVDVVSRGVGGGDIIGVLVSIPLDEVALHRGAVTTGHLQKQHEEQLIGCAFGEVGGGEGGGDRE